MGTPVEAYDLSGKKVWEQELDIYGKVIGHTGDADLIPFRFQGQYDDIETGLYYNRFRYYDPDIGQYTQPDPIGLEGGNPTLYSYVNNPNWWVDPLGLERGVGTSSGLTGTQPQIGWRVGDPITNLTRAGNNPTWNTIRQRYWRNEAHFNSSSYSSDNLLRMQRGSAPLHPMFNVPMELHHINGRIIPNPHNITNLQQVWPWRHAAIDPFRFYNGPGP